MGSLCILSSFIRKSDKLNKLLYNTKSKHWQYLLYTLIISLIFSIIGLIIETYIRYKFGVPLFTILSSMGPNTSTSSVMHSHVYKSVIGSLSNSFVPSHINTGSSILQYTTPYSLVILVIGPIIYLLGLISLSKMKPLSKGLSIFLVPTLLIGLVDGGLFSQPFLIGFGFLLMLYFMKGNLIINQNNINVKLLINPFVILGYILLLGIILEIGGSGTTCHTLTVINQTEPINMDNYNITNITYDGDKTIYTFNTNTPDKLIIKEVFESFKGKASLTFMSWNFYSYFY